MKIETLMRAAVVAALVVPGAALAQTTTTTTVEDTSGASTAVGAGTGAAIGAVAGGPVGALIGAVVGGAGGAAVDPGPRVTSYVTQHPVEPVMLQGDLVVGAGIPDAVTLVDVPDSTFAYTYVNGVPVIVERSNRRIVQIVQ